MLEVVYNFKEEIREFRYSYLLLLFLLFVRKEDLKLNDNPLCLSI